MATVSYPGVYVEEVSSGVRPIALASTSTAAFVGVAQKGPIGEPVKVFNFTEYQNLFGDFIAASYLSHAVHQFFNNGGAQCYVVRVAGANVRTADVSLNDRAGTAQESLTISAVSPGGWGNDLAVTITNGTSDSGNEFNLSVAWEGAAGTLEVFENLSMVPAAPNFVEKATAGSNFIRIDVNPANSNAVAGTSRGSAPPLSLTATGRTRLRINVNGDGYQEVDLQDAVTAGTVADLGSAANVATAIASLVQALSPLRQSTPAAAFTSFAATVSSGVLLLSSGAPGVASSVNVAAATDASADASGLLNLGTFNGGIEVLGGAVTRPQNGSFLVGDNAVGGAVAGVTDGFDGDPVTSDQPYVDALNTLDPVDDVSLLAVPGIGSPAVVSAGMNYCENRSLSDCFFIGDMAMTDDTVGEAQSFKSSITVQNSYGAVYLPWVKTLDPTGQSPEPILVPPSGFVAGIYAKTDSQRGVWKAPAGLAARVGGSVGLAVNLTDVQQGNLNPRNINVIRRFQSGIVLWGARTVTSDPEWNYIPVRRMAIMLRVSIYRGIQWAVFEPNDAPLWASLRLNIGAMMMRLFRSGAFQGASPADAFFVKCDGETTTQADIDAGIVNVLVGFAPLKPAEFIVVKISQKAGQSA